MRRAFTLLEILIVLMLMGIILGITFRFGSQRLQDLSVQTNKEEFVDTVHSIHHKMLSNPYYEQKAIDYLDVSIQQKSSGLQLIYAFTDATTSKEWQASRQYLSINNMSYQQEDVSAFTMRFKPYQTSCTISIQQESITTGEINITLTFTNNATVYCFALMVGTCTLQQVSCPNL